MEDLIFHASLTSISYSIPYRQGQSHKEDFNLLLLSFVIILRFPHLKNKNTGYSDNFEFRVSNKYFLKVQVYPKYCMVYTYMKNNLFFMWDSNLTGSPVFYLALLNKLSFKPECQHHKNHSFISWRCWEKKKQHKTCFKFVRLETGLNRSDMAFLSITSIFLGVLQIVLRAGEVCLAHRLLYFDSYTALETHHLD